MLRALKGLVTAYCYLGENVFLVLNQAVTGLVAASGG